MAFMVLPNLKKRRRQEHGFSAVELLATTTILMLAAGMATFGLQSFMRSYRTASDARSIASQVSLAKMRAASSFTETRVSFNVTARTYQIELFNKATNTWAVEGGTYFLSPGVNFGTGSIGTPAGEQTTIQQKTIIRFNTRSIPVDGAAPHEGGGTPTGEYAIYITNNAGQNYAVTVSATGRVNTWQYWESAWKAR